LGSEDPFEDVEVPETQKTMEEDGVNNNNQLPNFDLGITTTKDFEVHSQGDDDDDDNDPTLCLLHSTGLAKDCDDGFDWFDNKCNRCLQYKGKKPEPPKFLTEGIKTPPSNVFELLKNSSNPSGALPKLSNDEAVKYIMFTFFFEL
jgi:hypothetical protein